MDTTDAIKPTRREFVSGLALLLILAAVVVSRPDSPRQSYADLTGDAGAGARVNPRAGEAIESVGVEEHLLDEPSDEQSP